ncbi:flagellar component of cell-proximal portion of basal-body rod [Rubrivivax sp. A210]|uniref:flagellar basal-body rod protein FlgF n=1 Tax=Rubrivivax sp. A210 TaxID=2772301 RepID=UPI0019194F91|nr:flagellar basal-body rod protein FlgF [Rubrivivax sp. A210]CAD5374745.1 flagellar component of cell-proximal portion of basal-body rod [Rubrivivax sp. A210]
MDRLIYLSMSGAKATLQRQDTLANNLANASTNGFRAEMQAFRAVPVRGDGASTRVFALESTVGADMRAGPMASTGRSLDVAMQGNAWLAVQALDGAEAYTRAGALEVNAEGQLVTPAGLPVLGDGGPITLPANAVVEIATDGSITTTVAGARPQQAGKLKLVEPETPLSRGTDGLFRAADGGDLQPAPAARLLSGTLEGSNVSAVETMIAMIAAARQFEQQIKMLQGAEQRDQGAARLLSAQ